MRESGRFTILDIYQKAQELGEPFSKSSFYRHFSKHFVEKEKEPIVYDYTKDDSQIIDEVDMFYIVLEFFKGRASKDEIQCFQKTSAKYFENFHENTYPILTSNIFQEILRELLIHTDLQNLLDAFQEEYSMAVNRALTSEYYQKNKKLVFR